MISSRRSTRTPAWGRVSSCLVLATAALCWAGCAPRQQEQQQGAADSGQVVTGNGRRGASRQRSNIPDPPPTPGRGPTAPISATDPCATRLHDLCGPLLHYYALNRRLPERLDDVQALAGADPAVAFDCPVSGRPYVYVPGGFAWGDKPGFIVLHDAEPSHSGFRWAVVVEEPRGAQPLVTRVVAVPEPWFLSPGRVGAGGGAGQE